MNTRQGLNTSGDGIDKRHTTAAAVVRGAANTALALFREHDSLSIDVKGMQDWVSNADKSVESEIRQALAEAYPDDAIIGEEHGQSTGSSGYTWVIDPIDGTSNYIVGSPGWCVVLALVFKHQTVSAHIIDPVSDEAFSAVRSGGAMLNGKRINVSAADSLQQGTVSVGHSLRVPIDKTLDMISGLLNSGGLYRRSGSGALDLAYVACGRLLGYFETHMNSWDCIAAMLLIEEAGGLIQPYQMDEMLGRGGQVIAGCPGVFASVQNLAESSGTRD